jgi:hypothetical protein
MITISHARKVSALSRLRGLVSPVLCATLVVSAIGVIGLASPDPANANVCSPWPSCFGGTYQVTGTADNALTEWTFSPSMGGTAIRSVANGYSLVVGCQANDGPQEDGKYNVNPTVPSTTWDFAWDAGLSRFVWVYDWWMNTPSQNANYSWYSWPDSSRHCNFSSSAGATPASGSTVIGPGCPGWNPTHADSDFSGGWQGTGGDYTGSRVIGNASASCSGNSDFILDGSSDTAVFRWHLEVDTTTTSSCHVWAYIPADNAGDHNARYDFWADDGLSGLHWLGWPGHTINQEPISGWADLGSVSVPANTYLLTITLNNQDASVPGWYAGAGDMAINCEPSVTFNSNSARADLINRIASVPADAQYNIKAAGDPGSGTMDTMMVMQDDAGGYLAVYHDGSTPEVKLAQSSDLRNWTYVTTLDVAASSQAYLAEEPNKTYILAEEAGVGSSNVQFLLYANLPALKAGNSVNSFTAPRLLSNCGAGFGGNEGTPDIHGINANGTVIQVGFHYNSDCNGLDREAFGTLTNFTATSTNTTWTATADSARDSALSAAGYPGKHGDRADVWWHGYRFSLQEAQNNANGINDTCRSPCTTGFRSFRAVIYDYQTRGVQAVPFHTAGGTSCYGNPSISLIKNPSGALVFAVGLYLFSECVQGGDASGELFYTVPAQ